MTRSLVFRVMKSGDAWLVRLSCDGFASAEGEFKLDLQRGSRLRNVIDVIDADQMQPEILEDVGVQLWSALLSGSNGERFEEICSASDASTYIQLRLNLPPELAFLPWETLYDEKVKAFFAKQRSYCIIRDAPDTVPKRNVRRRQGKLSVLVVVPSGAGLQSEDEFKNIKNTVAPLGDAIRLERMQGLVTPSRLSEKLEQGWDVVHFIGHGRTEYDASNRPLVTIRLNDESPEQDHEFWASAQQFEAIFQDHPVRLAFLNCCFGGATSTARIRSLSGLGPFLLNAGIGSVIAMRYAIQDDVALMFAAKFYEHLLSEPDAGNIDVAFQYARRHLFLNYRRDTVRSFITPVLFSMPGHEKLEVAGVRARGVYVEPAAITIPEQAHEELLHSEEFRGLLDAVRAGRCVPIVGPGLARSAAVRSTEYLGPAELANLLATDFAYPRRTELEQLDPSDDKTVEHHLQRVCQYIQVEKRAQTYKMFDRIRATYATAAPPKVFRALATWRSPAVVYTYFDGLLAQACDNVRVVNHITQDVPADTTALLIHLRGTITAPTTMVLSEIDNDALLDAIPNASPRVNDLASGDMFRTLLFVGVNPFDPVLRRFAKQLMPTGPTKNQGPIFFVSNRYSDVDYLYWKKLYDVHCFNESPHVFVQLITEAINEQTGAIATS